MQPTVIFAVICLFQMFIPCFCGNEIEHDSNFFSQDVFESDWDGDNEDKRSKLFLMENLKRPQKIKGAKIYFLNLESFIKVKIKNI